ncbi:pyridoxal phosphate-dependent decarboxylase family protein [Plantactinospora solaniradicis]|uniref:Pyridoxal phosphate-dependent decarboxylase family protein n=1 Tax=Plantactinospora solaniradicis TaxID=1723736 RepID=A0ABW1K3T2_9ACTN
MHTRLADDLERLPDLLESTRGYAARLLAGLDARPVARPPDTRPADPLPVEGIGLEGALTRFAERWEPGLSGSAGPRYLGFVTGGATPASVAGDWLTSTLDQNVASDGDSSAPDLERETLDWLRKLFGLTRTHTGAFVSGATMSNVVGLAIGREWLGEQYGISVAQAGTQALPAIRVLSGSPHSSIYKALSILGIGREQLHQLPVLPGREAVDVSALAAALSQGPAIVVANAGTVNTADFDNLRAIAALKRDHRFWLHVDGAFGLFAALSPDHAHLVDGLAEADSVCVDLHKWLNVPYDAAVQFTRRQDLQLSVFHNDAAYLGAPAEEPEFVHLTPENSRRMRALPAWFSLTAYGLAGHREIVERNIASARRLGARLATLPGVRLLAPVRLNVVCFTVDGDASAVFRSVAETGEAFLTPTVYAGRPGLRIAFSNWRTGERDEERVFDVLRKVLA